MTWTKEIDINSIKFRDLRPKSIESNKKKYAGIQECTDFCLDFC